MRSRQPDPLGPDVVHVREDCRNGASLAGQFGLPCGGVQTFDQNLVHAIVDGKELDCVSAELSLHLGPTGRHAAPFAGRIFRSSGEAKMFAEPPVVIGSQRQQPRV